MTYNMTINLSHQKNFESKAEMDKTVREYNKELTPTLYRTLNLLKQYSLKVIGVSHLKYQTIADKLEVSTRTVMRNIKKLIELRIITKISTTRIKSGGDGANVFVINTLNQRKKLLSKIKNVTARLSPRFRSEKDGKTLSQQAMSYVKLKKNRGLNYTSNIYINLLSLQSKTVSKHKQQVADKFERIENIKTFREKPYNCTDELYMKYKALFTDAQIQRLITVITQQMHKFDLSAEHTHDIIDNTLSSLVKAMRKYHRNEGAEVKNMFSYVSKTAQTLTLRQQSKNAFDFLFA